MKTITVKADRDFDVLLTRLARRLKTTRSDVIRSAVRSYQQQLERESLRRRVRNASLITRTQAIETTQNLESADTDGL